MAEITPGARLGPYELQEELGKGGMATVYRAYQPNMDRFVAVKVIHSNLSDESVGLERFQREARLVARLEHPHILPVYDYNGTHTPPYIVMRYLPGGTLEKRLKGDRLPLALVLKWLKQLASALDYAHRQGIVHRDLKPSNVIIDAEDNAFLADFGIARVTESTDAITKSGIIVGTPAYMAPEQGTGAEVTPAADTYSLGVIAFEMLTGQPPFAADTPIAILFKHIQEPAPRASAVYPELPPAIDPIFEQALAKDAHLRPATAQTFIQALAEILGSGAGQQAAPRANTAADALTGRSSRLVTPIEQRRLVTVLYADWSEFERTLNETLDMEAANEQLAALQQVVSAQVQNFPAQGGFVLQHAHNALLALWGVELAREDDAERAIHAALALRDAAAGLERGAETALQICLATGDVLLIPQTGAAATPGTAQFRATGAVLSTTSRIAESLKETSSGVVITQATYRLVRGVFNVTALPPLTLRRDSEALEIFQVQNAKPRAFRIAAGSVEGIEAKMVGRPAELVQLQETYETALEDQQAQLVVITGDPGIGKSRLALELEKWRELRPETTWMFRGRAKPEMSAQPFALLRNIFMFRFEIQDSDPLPEARARLQAGIAAFLEGQPNAPQAEPLAHRIGQLIGFDYSDSPYVRDLLPDAAQFRQAALQALAQFFRAVGQPGVVVAVDLEDLHWADTPSIHTLLRLFQENADTPLMGLALGRTELAETQPDLFAPPGGAKYGFQHLQLRPLSRRDSRKLVRDLLQKVNDLPDALVEWITERAEGNPFYIEELIKTLLDDRVIAKLADGGAWRVQMDRLDPEHMPATLNGLLQARLDSLSPDERAVLQRAAAVGQIFWRSAVADLEHVDHLQIPVEEVLRALARREWLVMRDSSAFAGDEEYTFVSILLHDAAYESALKRQQRQYHSRIASWLLSAADQRQNEFALQIARHYEKAGETLLAGKFYSQAGDFAVGSSGWPEARRLYEKATQLIPESDDENSLRLHLYTLMRQSDLSLWSNALETSNALSERALEIARRRGVLQYQGRALTNLGTSYYYGGQTDRAKTCLHEALEIAQRIGNKPGLLQIYRQLGNLSSNDLDTEQAMAYYHQARQLAQELDSLLEESVVLNNIASTLINQGRVAEANPVLEQALGFYQTLGEGLGKAYILNNLAEGALYTGDLSAAESYAHQGLQCAVALGGMRMVGTSHQLLAVIYSHLGRLPEARTHLTQAIQILRSAQLGLDYIVYVYALACYLAATGETTTAVQIYGTIEQQITANVPVPGYRPPFIQNLRAFLLRFVPEEELETAAAADHAVDFDAELNRFLAEK